jgi:hypothetical protein
VIEAGAGLVVLWLVTGERLSSHRAERTAQQLIAASFLALALYVTIESTRDVTAERHPAVSWAGVALAAVTLIAMPPLAAAKRKIGTDRAWLGSDRERESANDALRLPLSRSARGLARKRSSWMVVG